MVQPTKNPFAIIKPVDFQVSMLTSSTVLEADPPAWSAGATYSPGDVVSVAATQRCYECLSANSGVAPAQAIDGPSPKWKVSNKEALTWNAAAFYQVGAHVRLASTHRVYECAMAHQGTNGTSATVTLSIASPCVVTWPNHGQPAGTQVILSSTGYLPGGVVADVPYYMVAVTTNSFSLATEPNGTPVGSTGVQTGTHTATVRSTSPDLNAENKSDKWILIGATNAFAAFDDKWGTQMTALRSLSMTITPGEVVDSIALLNLLGSQVTITCTAGGQTIYSKTISLQTDIGVYDWKTYFIAPIVTQDDVVVTDLLPYYNQVITITITGPAAVAIGNVAIGRYVRLGELEWSPKAGITTYGSKDRDRWGNVSVVAGPFNKRFSGRVVVDGTFVDQIAAILAQLRDTPVVWIGAGNLYSCLIVWGFFKDFEVDVAFKNQSYCTITIEGLV